GVRVLMEAGARFVLSDVFVLRLAAGGGADVTFVEPKKVAGSDVIPGDPRTATFPVASGNLAVLVNLTRLLSLAFGVDMVAYLTDVRYAISDLGQPLIVVHPWRVQPALWAGLTLTLD